MMTAEYSSKNYREAMTKEQQCKVALEGWGEYQARRKEYQEYCPKSKSNNIVFCPQNIIKGYKDKQKKDKQGNLLYKKAQRANDYFKSLGGKSKKGKTEKKGKKKKKQTKKKKKKRQLKNKKKKKLMKKKKQKKQMTKKKKKMKKKIKKKKKKQKKKKKKQKMKKKKQKTKKKKKKKKSKKT